MDVNKSHCAGCGTCLQVCPTNAIQLVDNKAWIDARLCNGCQACAEVCPSDAIITTPPITIPILPTVRTSRSAKSADMTLTQMRERKLLTEHSRVIAPAVSATLLFLGREIAPRVASAVVETLLNRTHPSPITSSRKDHQRRLRKRARGIDQNSQGSTK